MGYSASKTLIYGVKVHEDVARQIVENDWDEDNEYGFSQPEGLNIFMPLRQERLDVGWVQKTPMSSYNGHRKVYHDDLVFNLVLMADGVDFRIHPSSEYEEGFDHYFGIKVASYDDDLSEFLKNEVPAEAVERFDALALAVLKKYGVENVSASYHVVVQTS
jgi:hypothetical protein